MPGPAHNTKITTLFKRYSFTLESLANQTSSSHYIRLNLAFTEKPRNGSELSAFISLQSNSNSNPSELNSAHLSTFC